MTPYTTPNTFTLCRTPTSHATPRWCLERQLRAPIPRFMSAVVCDQLGGCTTDVKSETARRDAALQTLCPEYYRPPLQAILKTKL
mmetsp:Transcript_47362/g.76321  ORF Transcript_47362/g.76321 Transcript_47362/m.76321 type:complete len:85 (+) Transcript_47362:354-608(+)